MRLKRIGSLAAAAALVAVPGCDLIAVSCTTDFRYGLRIEVTDAVTGEPIVEGVVGTLTDGAYSETMMLGFGNTLVGAGERAGRYTAVVEAPGYRAWQQAGLRVRADACHVILLEVDARLTPN